MIRSVEFFFKDRSVISILHWAGFSSMSSVTDCLEGLIPNPSLPSVSTTPNSPLLRLHLSMSQSSFVAVQFLQSVSSISVMPPSILSSEAGELNTILPHHSLFTLYVSGFNGNVLILSSLQHQSQDGSGQEEEGSLHSQQTKSIKVSAQVKCPVVQANLSVLLNRGEQVVQLPGLVPVQQQLDFNLKLPAQAAMEGSTHGVSAGVGVMSSRRLLLCDLLEAGIKDVVVSFAAHIVQSTVRPDPILTWDSLEAPMRWEDALSQKVKEETAHHLLYADISIPVVWCQLASPQCGLPDPSSSGVDLLILHDAIVAWRPFVETLKVRISSLLSSKTSRDKRVLLALISNALENCPMLEKPFNPVLAQPSVLSRETVVFSCLHHMWRALPVYSEIHVPSPSTSLKDDDALREYVLQLVALILALASKLYSLQGMKVVAKEPEFVRPVSPSDDESDQCSVGTVGYISISPSPSYMAIPNQLFANRQLFEEEADLDVFSAVDVKTLAVLREALIPLFSAIGIPLERRLQMPYLDTSEFIVDFTLELKEATLFAVEHVSPTVLTYTTATTPTLLAEQLLINGRIKHNSAATSPQEKEPLLLPVVSNSDWQAKVAVVSDCSAAVETVHLVVTAPLLKLAKHVTITGKLRRRALKQARLKAIDAMETPRPTQLSPPSPLPVLEVSKVGHVEKLASTLVSHLRSLENKAVPYVSVMSTALRGSSARLLDYVESPKPVMKTSPFVLRNEVGSPSTSLPVPSFNTGDDGKGFTLRADLPSSYYSSSDQEVSHTVIGMEYAPEGTSPEDVLSTMDTCGEDTTDSQRIVSSENEGNSYVSSKLKAPTKSSKMRSPLTYLLEPTDHAHSLRRGLALQESQLMYSVFGLLKVKSVKCEVQIETTRASLELIAISAAIDTRNSMSPIPANVGLPFLSEVLPTYLSIAATLRKSILRVNDKGLPDYDLLKISILPVYMSIAINNSPPVIPNYRCLLRLTSLQVDVKQSAVKVHKRFQLLMPTFTDIYHDIFGEQVEVVSEAATTSSPSTSNQQLLSVESMMSIHSKLPQGFLHLSLDKAQVYVAPLPSLSVTYTVSLCR